jgi:outer membrane protein assembly factor BamB
MPQTTNPGMIYLGIKGSVIALSPETGEILWTAHLTGGDFVTLHKDGDLLLAATKGEIFCLNSETGEIRWRNKLPGMGLGIVTIATASGSTAIAPQARQKCNEDAAAAAL